MLTLIESRRRRQRTIGGTTASVLVHATLITFAVYVTAQAKELPVYDPPETPIPLFPPSEPKPDTHTPHTSHGGTSAPGPTTVPKVPALSIRIPDSLPPIDSAHDLPCGAFDDSVAAQAPGGARGAHDAGDGAPYVVSQVDKPAVASAGNLTPRYPSILEQSRVEGAVVAQFVVDTAGRAEMSTFEILRSTNELFASALRDVVPHWRFLPAEAAGRRVRQVVQIPVRFVAPRPH